MATSKKLNEQNPTIVLVHGAFADSSSWNGVLEKLQSHDYPVIAASNPLRGLADDAEYVRQLVASIDGPVLLVGHSYGGSVIRSAAKGLANVKALAFVAAFLPDEGESAIALSGKFPGSTLGEALRPVPVTLPGGSQVADLYIKTVPPAVRRRRTHRNSRDHGCHAAARDRRAALAEGSAAPAWRDVPSWVLVATEDRNIPPRTQAFVAERADATVISVPASHAVSVSRPGDVARLINEAAQATT